MVNTAVLQCVSAPFRTRTYSLEIWHFIFSRFLLFFNFSYSTVLISEIGLTVI